MIDRLKLLMQAKNLSPAEFADSIDVQRSGISHLLSGRNNPSLGFVEKVLLRFPEINPDWLILGKGAMHRNDAIKEISLRETTASNQNSKAMNLFDSQPLEDTNEPEKYAESFDIIDTGDLFSNDKMDAIEEKAMEEIPIEENAGKVESLPIEKNNANSEILNLPQNEEKKIERIVFFYSDRSFKEFKPE